MAAVYSSDGAPPNTPPGPPGRLSGRIVMGGSILAADGLTSGATPFASSAEGVRNEANLSWDVSVDAQTPSAGLSYNLRIGTTPGGSEILSPLADAGSGYRHVVALGNAQQRTSWTGVLEPGTYYWSVQAIDGAYAGSAFTEEQVLAVASAVEDDFPRALSLTLADANPAPGVVRLRFGLPTPAQVDLSIYDVAGRRLVRLVDGECSAGYHTVSWGAGARGGATSSGVYFARLATGGRVLVQRMIRLR